MKPGDKVRPKGYSGPIMTVVTVSTTGIAHCTWWVDGEAHRDNFSMRYLRLIKRSKR